jgi:hypothetical protein
MNGAQGAHIPVLELKVHARPSHTLQIDHQSVCLFHDKPLLTVQLGKMDVDCK